MSKTLAGASVAQHKKIGFIGCSYYWVQVCDRFSIHRLFLLCNRLLKPVAVIVKKIQKSLKL
ncbi:hypothetical protein M976_01488 [Buttiauxella ferragutiae ATCC 51602]|uniref:Uncharacterized protein n=1 Tax=Buttiauxella ferragutiae ATCC 51602 TaxID=1354252 RepID=A0ABX2WA41_9ENTR|nr:hypothetical protein M976_01488 [Buttiauxella ferragutiae ATCC 51602]